MADGRIFRPNSNAAASKTLPLGTVAKVTNLKNGLTTTVHVEDRGPYVHGRVIDVTPKTARQLGMKRAGLAHVVIKPVSLSAGKNNAKSLK
jgi:rare lipoprotein A